MTHEVNYPEIKTYFIGRLPNGYSSHGVIEPTQCMTTGLEELETFTDEAQYLARAAELGIVIESEENEGAPE